MPADNDCLSCANSVGTDLPPRERVYFGPRWRVAHAFGTALPGWMVVMPRRHVLSLDELTPAEAADLGPLLRGPRVFGLLADVGCCGKQVHDANMVATMLVHGIGTVVTMNLDDFVLFERYVSLVGL